MAMDMDAMLAKIKDRQWALADIDWDAPGVETISDEFRPKLKAFMADLCWIENVGARGFAAMAKKAPTPTIAEIYRYFHAEEQRHANAELALLKRWGMLEDGEIPEPSVNIRLAIEWLDKYADDMPLSVLGTVIPMLEVALDGALLKFLLEEVHDPVCHQVFEKINNDESRHIAVDFEVLDMIGHAKARRLAIEFVGNLASPGLVVGAIMYVPLLNRMRNNIVDMGLEPERLYAAMNRFKKLGSRGTHTHRVPLYQVLKWHSAMVVDPKHPYHLLANSMVWASEQYPRVLLRPIPSWFKELTFEPVSADTGTRDPAAKGTAA
ncbi:MAG: ferritin-like domain-containing protein [Nocardioides sp.]